MNERRAKHPESRAGRGANRNPAPRYLPVVRTALDPADDGWGAGDEVPPPLKTTVTPERTRSIISHNDSPDIPFDASINPYKGCEHGCVYCFARPTHAYLDLSPGLDFESRIFSKPDAARLLRRAFRQPRYRPEVIALGVNTDAYQPPSAPWGSPARCSRSSSSSSTRSAWSPRARWCCVIWTCWGRWRRRGWCASRSR